VPRFRLPVEPLLNLAAGAGVAMLLNRRKLTRENPEVGICRTVFARDVSCQVLHRMRMRSVMEKPASLRTATTLGQRSYVREAAFFHFQTNK
jgi:hypothetical protein